MKIDMYHLYRRSDFTRFLYPIILEVLARWAKPHGHEANSYIKKEEHVNLDTDAEVVAFSVYTQTANSVYRLTKKLRAKNKIVILGGPHFRGDVYKEALELCDVVVSSVSENVWVDVLNKIEKKEITANRSKAIHIEDTANEFRYPENFTDSFNKIKWFQVQSIPTTLGCPYSCEFCAPHFGKRYYPRDVDTIYNELKALKNRWLFFADAAFGLNKKHTLELMNKIAPLKKKILVETTLVKLADPEFVEAMRIGGVTWISIGLESISSGLSKNGKITLEQIKEIIANVHSKGMLIQANFILGLDSDGTECFQNAYDFYANTDIDLIFIDILTPYPNTELYQNLKKENRIFDFNWDKYDYRHVVYTPKNMTVDELAHGFVELQQKITNLPITLKKGYRIIRRTGFTLPSLAIIVFGLFTGIDARRKSKRLKRDLQLRGQLPNKEMVFPRAIKS